MCSGWLDVTIGDVSQLINGDRGKNYPSHSDRVGSGIPFINTGHIDPNGRLNEDRMDFIPRERFDLLRSGKVIPGDILYCLRGSTIGKAARNHYEEGAIASSLIIVRANEGVCQDFLYFFLTSPQGQWLVKSNDNGSAQPNLSGRVLSQCPLRLPPYKEQVVIAHILNSLDNKILLNHQINQTLEQMAQALFKSWFVDFNPVMDKLLASGKPIPDALKAHAERRSQQLQQLAQDPDHKPLADDVLVLFPDEFEFTGQESVGIGGWVPKGWVASTVGSCFDVTMGQSPPGSTYNEDGVGMPFFQGKTDFGFRYPKNRIYCTEPKRIANESDTLISVRAPVGDANMASEKCILGRGVAAVRHKSGAISYTYYSMKQLEEFFKVFESEGTVFGSINQKDFKALPVVSPDKDVVKSFEKVASGFDQKIRLELGSIGTLEKLRDTLLPKLISGELRIPHVDDAV